MKKRLGARSLSRKVPDSEQVLVTTVCRCKLKDLKAVEVYPVEKAWNVSLVVSSLRWWKHLAALLTGATTAHCSYEL